jgi:hypothetical protein
MKKNKKQKNEFQKYPGRPRVQYLLENEKNIFKKSKNQTENLQVKFNIILWVNKGISESYL